MIWLYNHGTVQLQTNYLKKDYQPVVNCFQASILCLFNNNDVLTYSQIKEKAGLSDQDVKDSMLKMCNPKIKIISVRAGNIIGAGDFAKNRIIPDLVKAWKSKKKLIIRNPKSTRPWQYILDVLISYMNHNLNLK